MSYNGSGTFNINTTGQPVVAGTIISAATFNALTADLGTGLTTAVTKDGQTTTTARIPFAQGINSTLVTDASSVSTGSIITAGGVGIAKKLYVGTDANIAGALNVTGDVTATNPIVNNLKLGYTTTATAAGTTTLSVTSNYRQLFTGVTTQTLVLPVTSTLALGMAYLVENNSTGLITVQSSGLNTIVTVLAGTSVEFVCILVTGTTAASWDLNYVGFTSKQPVALGGTGATTLTANNVILGNGTSAVQFVAPGSSGNVLTSNGTTWTSVVGPAGDVAGPASSTANGIALFSGTTGKLLKDAASTDGLINGLTVGKGLTSKSESTAFGVNALAAVDTGNGNTAVGANALAANTSAINGVAVGRQSLLSNVNGSSNTAIGNNSLVQCDTGVSNVAVGAQALQNLTSGNGNTALNPRTNGGVYAPIYDPVTDTNRFCMGSTAVTNAYIQVAWTVVSDIRDKTDIATVPHGLNFISQIDPIAYRYKVSRDVETAHGPVRYGFKAQQILAIEGDNSVIVDAENLEKLRLNDQSLIAVMVNAIKELNQKVESLAVEIATLKGN